MAATWESEPHDMFGDVALLFYDGRHGSSQSWDPRGAPPFLHGGVEEIPRSLEIHHGFSAPEKDVLGPVAEPKRAIVPVMNLSHTC